ncbi:MAG: hypothetical protein QXE01_10710 [Sulfolobales archaeon]
MCRILILFGGSQPIARYRDALIESLLRASEFDPYGGFLTGSRGISHKDGWGRLSVLITSRGVEKLAIAKSIEPFYSDVDARTHPHQLGSRDGAAVEMIHVRAAATGMPINIFSTHPAEAVTSEGYRLYLIHNGTVDKDRILEDLGIDGRGVYASLYNDTYFLAQMIATRIRSHIDEGILREIIGYTVSALNMGAILVREHDVEVVVGSFYRVYDRAVERRNYYKIYRAVSSGPIYIYSSSTTIDIYRPDLDLGWIEIPNGLFEVYRIWYDDLPRVEKRFEAIYPG